MMIAVAGCRGVVTSAAAGERCLASAEAIAVAPRATGAGEPEKRCGASAEAIAGLPSA